MSMPNYLKRPKKSQACSGSTSSAAPRSTSEGLSHLSADEAREIEDDHEVHAAFVQSAICTQVLKLAAIDGLGRSAPFIPE
jgi:hypothetical protein